MKFTLSWLKDYLKVNQKLDQICQKLTDIGLEVEDVVDDSELLQDFTVAQILEAQPHPNANKLRICKTDIGNGRILQIVCGAPNAREGIKVIYAPIGSVIPTNQMKIKKSKIRDVESFGMLCSAAELGLGQDSDGIVEIGNDVKIGTKIIDIFNIGDPIIDINITPNRGDCLGVYGIARDLSSAGMGELQPPKIQKINGSFKTNIKVSVAEDAKEICPTFLGYEIKDVKNQETPEWLKARLEPVGINSINAIVDITNYVMLCLNQPLHAYDADKISGNINVRTAKKGEEFTSLKDVTYKLNGGELLICDDKKIAGLAGIVGGKETTTELETTNIFLEGAFFEATNIARTGRKLNILSDARYRFERNIDPNNIKLALDMAANLILEICGGKISEISKDGGNIKELTRVNFDPKNIESLLNTQISKEEIIKILSNLGFNIVNQDSSILEVEVPSFRSDITIEQDLIEEVIRIYGYNKIKSEAITIEPISTSKNNDYSSRLRNALCNLGLDETINWSFIDSKIAANFSKINPNLVISNAISEEMDYMRPSLIPGLLTITKKNKARDFKNISLFEIGKIFLGTRTDEQINSVAAIRMGKNKEKNHYKDDRYFDVMDAKKDFLAALNILGINPRSIEITQDNLANYWHPYQSALVKMGKNIIGYFGQVHPIISKKMGLKDSKINAFEIFIDQIPGINKIQNKSEIKKAFIKSDFQIVHRDFSFIFDASIKAGQIIKIVKATNQELINDVNIFDIYQGEKIDQNKKSIAFNVEIVPKLNTLTSKEIDDISNNIIDAVSSKLNATLRDK